MIYLFVLVAILGFNIVPEESFLSTLLHDGILWTLAFTSMMNVISVMALIFGVIGPENDIRKRHTKKSTEVIKFLIPVAMFYAAWFSGFQVIALIHFATYVILTMILSRYMKS